VENNFVFKDTNNIVAVATSSSPDAALNIVRCSGKTIFSVYKKITKSKKNPKANSAFVHNLFDVNNNVVDQAVVLSFVGPKSFTGENMIEFSIHGGEVVLKNVIDCLLLYGCRLAEAGEFTYRAFVNGKVDLFQAESINSLIKAKNNQEAALALNNIFGSLSTIINKSIKDLVGLISFMEHELDFNDNEIDFIKQEKYIQKIEKIVLSVDLLIKSSFVLSDPNNLLSVCFVGKTNVGKSSLFNALLGKDRSITSKEAGTTRDVVSETLEKDNAIFKLIDTAGLRKTNSLIEKAGILKTNQEIKTSDLLLFIDNKNPENEFKKSKIKHKNILLVLSKQDKETKQGEKNIIKTSCKTGFGLTLLKSSLFNKIQTIKQTENNSDRFLLNLRQKKELFLFIKELNFAIKAFHETQDLAIVLSFLYKARNAATSTVAPLEKNEVLNTVFGGFCVGK